MHKKLEYRMADMLIKLHNNYMLLEYSGDDGKSPREEIRQLVKEVYKDKYYETGYNSVIHVKEENNQ